MHRIEKLDFCFIENKKASTAYTRSAELAKLPSVSVVLPHDIAFSVSKFKSEDELYFGSNICELQKYENLHCYYYTQFSHKPGKFLLRFNRIDVYSEIFLNGVKILETDNAFISFDAEAELKEINDLVIHIFPAMLRAQEHEIPAVTNMLAFSYPSAYMRKPMHLLGWDIFPRNVLGGIFAPIEIREIKEDEIKSLYIYTNKIENGSAELLFSYFVKIGGDFFADYELDICGECGDSTFHYRKRLWFSAEKLAISIKNPKLWTVRNAGIPNLYNVTVRLIRKQVVVDEKKLKIGVRKISIERSNDLCGGRFDVIVNGVRIFLKGVNWVPTSTFHSLCEERTRKALPYLMELGANAVRVWGGGIYESEEFYEYCDEHGILVWQDFMMACGIYPDDEIFAAELKTEAEQTIKRLRNHPSLAVWAGDNECDMFTSAMDSTLEPYKNSLTRSLLPRLLRLHDPARAYLPSSPYIDEYLFKTKAEPSEAHTWGARNFFKGEYYSHIKSAFVSENGYMGIPSVKSLEKFIPRDKLNEWQCEEYVIHSANPALDSPYSYRMGMTIRQIAELFGVVPESIEEISLASRLTEAEADKYFIEYMRCRKDRRGGILIWNLIDGWPQISDSLIDYYHEKKEAFRYVKTSFRDFLLAAEECDEFIELYAINDTFEKKIFTYRLRDAETDEIFFESADEVAPNAVKKIARLEKKKYQQFIIIDYTFGTKNAQNHFVTDIKRIPFEKYLACARKAGLIEKNAADE